MRYLFIINSKSQTSTIKELEDAISELDDDLRVRIEFRYTEYPGHARDIAVEASDANGAGITIVSCGGDGTFHEIANALAFRSTPIICIPMGTGNDFARIIFPQESMKKPFSQIRNLDSVKVVPIDLVRLDSYDMLGSHIPIWSCYFNNIASIGLGTQVQYLAKTFIKGKDTKFNRKTAYVRAALKSIFGNRDSKFTYSLELENGETYTSNSDTHTLISLCNGRYYGDGFCPAPKAKISDGILDVCVVESVSFFRSFPLLLHYRKGTHAGKQGISTYRVTSGIVTCQDSSFQLLGNYDGEDFFGDRIRFEVFSNALNLGIFPGVEIE